MLGDRQDAGSSLSELILASKNTSTLGLHPVLLHAADDRDSSRVRPTTTWLVRVSPPKRPPPQVLPEERQDEHEDEIPSRFACVTCFQGFGSLLGIPPPCKKKLYREVRQRHWGSGWLRFRLPQNRMRVWLGTYETAEAAGYAYDQAAYKLRGEYARLNFSQPRRPPPSWVSRTGPGLTP
ncbi:hypothetical protein MLD38_009956 [Melastoma candidum]|uniref:Uncharacterized protein n=1 Tax=Melastoma candidum TaxID=119954 RepID=A0ACB9R1U9_9MYRT|nr:hypothetical protein MLD38_009956 [Melastoma candidum]